ncbi:MAG: FHA domain-containing protein [Actinobacteria bacterium]|nr:FHA domain-containing protein [Actinomycetota bacterium]NIU66217.1 FHA domain-containing protein [Actinomycetota bacterium]NIV87024.1 FHA domain-containing protein [Actinomycetota bacterium]NIW28032.1 FHA domain-containing protein [Actinomycetota bacterium]NIX20518.1 FHA domain-containing protein [Actinomycetota bacterium]
MTVQKAAKVVPVPTLQFAAGALAGQTMRIEQDHVLIGRRSDNDVVIDDPHVSRIHAELRREGNMLVLTDYNSTSGTRVNDDDIVGTAVIRHGDTSSTSVRSRRASRTRPSPRSVTSRPPASTCPRSRPARTCRRARPRCSS